MVCVCLAEFEYVARLAVKLLADGLKCGEADCLGLTGLEDGEIRLGEIYAARKLAQRNFPLSHHYIQINYYRHNSIGWILDLVEN